MNRERSAWLLSFFLLAVAAFRSPTAAQRDDDYLFVRTLVDIQRQVLSHYVDKVDEKKLEAAAIDGMLNQLDPFSTYVPPAEREQFDRMLEGTFKGVGIQLNQLPNGAIEVVTPIENSPAFKAGVMAGDVILKVNGESVEGQRLPDIIKRIGGDLGSEVTLTVRHENGEVVDLSMKRDEIVLTTVKGFGRNPDNTWNYWVIDEPKIAYVRLTQFTPNSFETIRDITRALLANGMKGLILDMRWNPGGQLDQAVQIVDLFVEEGTIVSTRGLHRPEDVKTATRDGTLPWFPMIALVNEASASAAEIVAGSLLDNRRAAVLGERTYGKGSVQELMPLEGNNGELKLTVAHYYLPSGRLVHRKKGADDWGVQPQIVVPVDEETERRIFEERAKAEYLLRASTRASTRPTTQSVDTQLQRAIDTMLLMSLLQTNPNASTVISAVPANPTTRPTTQGHVE